MPTVQFTQNLRRHIDCPMASANGATVRQVLDAVFAANPRARSYVLDERGQLRKHMMIFVNGEAIADREGLADPIDPSGEIFVMQALSGGSHG